MPSYVRAFNNYKVSNSFTCLHCDAYSSHRSRGGCIFPPIDIKPENEHIYRDGFYIYICEACNSPTFFFKSRIIYPTNFFGPPPNEGMPEDIRADYEEARSIAEASPRSAAALLRLAIQKLCKHLGERGQNLNDDIGYLVKKGLPSEIQKALDIVRVVGNNAVHPGEIDLKDSPEICSQLFGLVNMIVDRMIVEPKKLAELFDSLPDSNLKAIEKRDAP